MNISNIPISVLCITIFALIALFVIIRGFKLPADFFERDRQRAAMRRRLRELETESRKEKEETITSAQPEKVEKKQETAEAAKKPAATPSANPPKK
jgi:hypothetical protein